MGDARAVRSSGGEFGWEGSYEEAVRVPKSRRVGIVDEAADEDEPAGEPSLGSSNEGRSILLTGTRPSASGP